jgi:SpoVK/Ycf46/Vps4 family AAA+-type ATPase
MYNNMQNLFLEGLERFEGLLIATTNRRDLLDQAFSRRFTYKWELPAPDATLRRAIWTQHLPAGRVAADVDLDQLAALGLTGGEIRLVVEQAVRRATSRGQDSLGHELLATLARQELRGRFDRAQGGKTIGFLTQEKTRLLS